MASRDVGERFGAADVQPCRLDRFVAKIVIRPLVVTFRRDRRDECRSGPPAAFMPRWPQARPSCRPAVAGCAGLSRRRWAPGGPWTLVAPWGAVRCVAGEGN